MIWWTIAAFFFGGTLGILSTALAAASRRVEELEAQLWSEYEEEVDEEYNPGESRVLFILTTQDKLSDQTLGDMARAMAQATNGRVLILEQSEDEEEEVDE